MKLTNKELEYARDWLKDIVDSFRDLDEEQVDSLSESEVERAIETYFSGGIAQFKTSVE